jgi:hypothetical protein
VVKILESQGAEVNEERRSSLLADITTEMKGEDHPSGAPPSPFAASRGSLLPPPSLSSIGGLSLAGHIIDKVHYVGQVVLPPSINILDIDDAETFIHKCKLVFDRISQGAHYFEVLLEWNDIALRQTARYPSGEAPISAYWQTLCGGQYIGSHEDAEAEFGIWRNSLGAARLAKKLNIFSKHTPKLITLLGTRLCVMARGQSKAFFTMSGPILHRRLARTSKGYLGLVPAGTRVGDFVALLKGGALPFILRSRGGPWELVGASYIHGIMYGEAFDEQLCGDVELI